MEGEITNKLFLQFKIDVPQEIDDSDFNSLILRIDKLRYTRKNTITMIEVQQHNRNIEEAQRLLENFKIKTYKNELEQGE